ncbi:3-phosphoglycerate dehydrogenase [Vibrio splendidus]|uniref:D-2-hydroxyacid dehydrogenase family protein n=1 Tax=Vibrio lentus TaxID=136468 RepID=A0A4U2AVM6_9VIBR|nr:D-2-hydroxyacid dehydrogenase family protein [Vibrio lentus]OBS97525.1 3-phosphoglycerate dehydrogenase [Vibrio tasmaniensis]PHN84627.1 3-phosphoglycerate dehydrogenase [Vibrio splendidus]MCC4784931.1 D-2-hydroxyacid dehydrogenase family protein [Vibrio lentus]PME57255.1 3-phosphoglycerate dehydrogenase [Vibrio lentus]PMG60816.1 3-phosphoglycerate dehydrogenase [Vibrio lentus]
MKIAILDDYQKVVESLECYSKLEQHDVTVFTETYPEDELALKLREFDALVLIRERTDITESLLSRLPNLKLISQTGKVSNHINVQMCERFGVKVLEGRGSPVAPSELCWALIMAASRHIPTYASNLKQNQWQDSGSLGLGRTLKGLKLGIWGYGKIGKCIAQYAKAFGMTVVVWGSQQSRVQAQADGFEASATKEDFFRDVDVLSLHLRLNDATKGCVTANDLQLMKSDSLFVNISRSELVEPQALYRELCEVPTKRAAVDVFDCEPVTTDAEPLLSLPNVTATPHLGYVEQNSYELYFDIAFDNILSYQRDGM